MKKYANVIVQVETIIVVDDNETDGMLTDVDKAKCQMEFNIKAGYWYHVSQARICYVRND